MVKTKICFKPGRSPIGNKECIELGFTYAVGLCNPLCIVPMLLLRGIAARENPDGAIGIGQLEVHVLGFADDKWLLLNMLIISPAEVGAPWGASHIGSVDESITLGQTLVDCDRERR